MLRLCWVFSQSDRKKTQKPLFLFNGKTVGRRFVFLNCAHTQKMAFPYCLQARLCLYRKFWQASSALAGGTNHCQPDSRVQCFGKDSDREACESGASANRRMASITASISRGWRLLLRRNAIHCTDFIFGKSLVSACGVDSGNSVFRRANVARRAVTSVFPSNSKCWLKNQRS